MTFNPVYAKYGLSIAQGITGFIGQSIQAKLAATLQKYRNEIVQVQRSMNANRITVNEANTMDASVRLNFAIQQQAASDQGSAEVAAAAAGVKGGSVNSTMRGLRRSAAFAQGARKARTAQEMASHLAERRGNELSAVMNTDVTVHPKPSVFSAAMGIGMNLLNTYDANRTETERAASIIKQPATASGPPQNLLPSQQLGLGNTLLDQDKFAAQDYWSLRRK